MPLMDEFKEERAALKNGTFRQKMQYFWDYYKIPFIGGIIAICCIASFVHNIISAKETALSVAMLNCTDLMLETDLFYSSFAEYAGIDLDKCELTFDTDLRIALRSPDQASMNSMEKLMVFIAAGELDAMMGGGDVFAYYANQSVFTDLRTILSNEQISRYEPFFYYIDMDTVNQIQEISDKLQDSPEVEIPDPGKPEEMVDPVPVAIFIDAGKLENYFYFQNSEEGVGLGIFANASHPDTVLSFIDYLLQ